MNEEQKVCKQQLLCLRICAAACVAILVIVLVSALALVPRASAALEAVQKLGDVDWAQLTQSVQEGFTQVSQTLDSLDMESLNQAIQDLQSVVAPLAKLFAR